MNKRIRELAIQAVGDYSKDDYWPFFEEEMQKFAELITEEMFAEMAHQLFLHSDMQATDPGYRKAMSNTLKKFGIKECSGN
jgi:hypothetical protein